MNWGRTCHILQVTYFYHQTTENTKAAFLHLPELPTYLVALPLILTPTTQSHVGYVLWERTEIAAWIEGPQASEDGDRPEP